MRIHIFAGHFGSGKTEVALNFAVKQAEQGKKVTIIDLDIVNPYFRTNDAREILEKHGINVIASEFANSTLEMMTVPTNAISVFYEKDTVAIFDVGGDDDGAIALGQYKRFFENEPYRMYMVVNTKRPMTDNDDDLVDMAKAIESASRLRFTDIINNTNLGKATEGDTLLSDYSEVIALSEKTGIPVTIQSGLPVALANLPADTDGEKFPMEIFVKMPWEI